MPIFQVRQILAREAFKLNAELDEMRVVVDHDLVLCVVEGSLNVIADVMDATSTNVSTRPFQLMCTELHLVPILLI